LKIYELGNFRPYGFRRVISVFTRANNQWSPCLITRTYATIPCPIYSRIRCIFQFSPRSNKPPLPFGPLPNILSTEFSARVSKYRIWILWEVLTWLHQDVVNLFRIIFKLYWIKLPAFTQTHKDHFPAPLPRFLTYTWTKWNPNWPTLYRMSTYWILQRVTYIITTVFWELTFDNTLS